MSEESEASALDKAERAVSESIQRAAEQSGSAQPGPDDLKKLAEAVAAMKHGPQGGRYEREGRDRDSMDYNYTSDAHTTQHQGENRDRPPTGFQGG